MFECERRLNLPKVRECVPYFAPTISPPPPPNFLDFSLLFSFLIYLFFFLIQTFVLPNGTRFVPAKVPTYPVHEMCANSRSLPPPPLHIRIINSPSIPAQTAQRMLAETWAFGWPSMAARRVSLPSGISASAGPSGDTQMSLLESSVATSSHSDVDMFRRMLILRGQISCSCRGN